jgi:hypothetical protein
MCELSPKVHGTKACGYLKAKYVSPLGRLGVMENGK